MGLPLLCLLRGNQMALKNGNVGCGTVLIVQNANKQVLMIKRKGKHGSGTWCFPGGWVDPLEGPIRGAIRECGEEVGVYVPASSIIFLGYVHNVHKDKNVEDITLVFKSNHIINAKQPFIKEPDKIDDIGFYYWRSLPEPLFLPVINALHKNIIPDYPN